MSNQFAEFREIIKQRSFAVQQDIGAMRVLQQRLSEITTEIAELEEIQVACDESIVVLNSFADSRQKQLQGQIESLVTHGLRTIFDDGMSFHINVSRRGKMATADFVVKSQLGNKTVETSILDARGGGVAAVAGFLLRLVLLLLKKETPVLFLDESFAQLSAEYEPRLAEFVRELIDKTGTQIVLVTHSEAYSDEADVVYRFKNVGGVTQVAVV